MRKTYEVADGTDRRAISEFLKREGQFLIPMLELECPRIILMSSDWRRLPTGSSFDPGRTELRLMLVLTALALVMSAAACSTWRATTDDPRAVIHANAPSRARIHKADGTEILVRDPWIDGDSVAGELISPASLRDPTFQRVRVGLEDVTAMDIRVRNPGLTTLVVVAAVPVGLAVGGFVYLVAACRNRCGN